jgi:hypothetical protein
MSSPGDEPNDPFAPPPAEPPPPGFAPPPPGPPPEFAPAPYGAAAIAKPPTYLPWAIASTILCCLPLGVAAIVFANQVNVKYAAGDHAGAVEASRKARNFAIAAAVIGVIGGVLYFAAAGSDS